MDNKSENKIHSTSLVSAICQNCKKDFTVEPEITAKILKNKKLRVYEMPISYYGRSYEEGKKISWRNGFSALWALIKYRLLD